MSFHHRISSKGDLESTEPSYADDLSIMLGMDSGTLDETRRSIVQETEEILISIQNLMEEKEKEEKILAEVSKDNRRAVIEMQGLHQGAKESLENMAVNDEVRAGLIESIRNDIILFKSPQEAEETIQGHSKESSSTRKANLILIQENLKTNKATIKTLMNEMNTSTKGIEDLISQKKFYLEEADTVSRSIETEHLEEQLHQLGASRKADEMELNEEVERQNTLQATFETHEATVSGVEKEKSEKTKTLKMMKFDHASKEEEDAQSLLAAKEDTHRREIALAALEVELNSITNTHVGVKAQLNEAYDLSQAFLIEKKKRDEERRSRNELYSSKMKLETDVSNYKTKVEKNKADIADLDKKEHNLEKDIETNVRLEAKSIQEKSDYKEVLEMKTQLESQVKKIEKCHELDQLAKVVEDEKMNVIQLKDEISVAKLETETVQHKLEASKLMISELYETHRLEMDDLSKKEAEIEALHQSERKNRKDAEKAFSALKESTEKVALCRKLEILEYGKALLLDTQLYEEKLRDSTYDEGIEWPF